MKKTSKINLKEGQTLITILVFMVVAITITTSASMIILNSSFGASRLEQAVSTNQLAESGIDNALMRLLRDPNYVGETLTVGSGTITIVVSGSPTKIITSTGTMGNTYKKIQVTAGYSNGILVVTPPWQEIP